MCMVVIAELVVRGAGGLCVWAGGVPRAEHAIAAVVQVHGIIPWLLGGGSV